MAVAAAAKAEAAAAAAEVLVFHGTATIGSSGVGIDVLVGVHTKCARAQVIELTADVVTIFLFNIPPLKSLGTSHRPAQTSLSLCLR